MPTAAPAIVWFRQDLRLADNPALAAAAARGGPVLPVYILDDGGPWAPGGAARWWLHHSLASLAKALASRGAPLCLRRSGAEEVLPKLARDAGAGAVFWNRCFEPHAVARDTRLKQRLTEHGLEVRSFNGSLLVEPWDLKTGTGEAYKVFTPFWRALQAAGDPPAPLAAPKTLHGVAGLGSDDLADWSLLPTKPDSAAGLRGAWTPGESGAAARLQDFLEGAAATYKDDRDRPDRDGTSRLSPHLHWGEISPRQVWHALRHAAAAGTLPAHAAEAFLRQLGWRDFSHGLLYHWPDLPEQP